MTKHRDLQSQLDSWRDEPARAWRSRVGDVLVGELEGYHRGEGAYGPTWVAHVRDEKAGELRAVWLFHTVLLDEFRRLRPKPGERIGLRRLDDGGQEDRRYRRYALVVDREGASGVPDFDAFGPALDAVVVEPETPSPAAGNGERPATPFD